MMAFFNAAAGQGVPRNASIAAQIDGVGATPPAGLYAYFIVPVSVVVNSFAVIADQPGDAVIDVVTTSFDNFPEGFTSITNGSPIVLSGAQKAIGSTGSWAQNLGAGSVLAFSLLSAATLTRLSIMLNVSVP
jgi:hypothetical protein